MLDRLTETFLSEYFLFDAVLGESYERKKIFYVLGDTFCISCDLLEGLFDLTEREVVRDVTSSDSYNRFQRIVQYNGLVGNKPFCDTTESSLIALKGNAIRVAEGNRLIADRKLTGIPVAKTITDCAQAGNVFALRILGTMECEGILLDEKRSSGIKDLTKAMRWGDVPAALAMLRYSEKDRADTVKYLHSAVRNTPYEFFIPLAEAKYGASANGECNEEVLLVRKAISAKKIKPDVYDPLYARLLFSDLICLKEKERIVFSESREPVSETCDLPLYLPTDDIPVDERAFDHTVISRESECKKILQGLRNEDLRTFDSFRPICLCSESDAVLNTYEATLCEALSAAHVERIEVGNLKEFDIEPTKNNVFIRGLSEQKPNVYLLVFKGDVSDAATEYVKTVLKSDGRRRFRLKYPTVTIDLSSVLPICVCDRKNAKKIKECVDTVQLAPVKAEEKDAMIRAILQQKRRSYAIDDLTLTGETMDRIRALSVEAAEKILDGAVRENRVKGAALEITVEMIQGYLDAMNDEKTVYGFGGAINESR